MLLELLETKYGYRPEFEYFENQKLKMEEQLKVQEEEEEEEQWQKYCGEREDETCRSTIIVNNNNNNAADDDDDDNDDGKSRLDAVVDQLHRIWRKCEPLLMGVGVQRHGKLFIILGGGGGLLFVFFVCRCLCSCCGRSQKGKGDDDGDSEEEKNLDEKKNENDGGAAKGRPSAAVMEMADQELVALRIQLDEAYMDTKRVAQELRDYRAQAVSGGCRL